jgi:hypothetical protein
VRGSEVKESLKSSTAGLGNDDNSQYSRATLKKVEGGYHNVKEEEVLSANQPRNSNVNKSMAEQSEPNKSMFYEFDF